MQQHLPLVCPSQESSDKMMLQTELSKMSHAQDQLKAQKEKAKEVEKYLKELLEARNDKITATNAERRRGQFNGAGRVLRAATSLIHYLWLYTVDGLLS